MTNPMESMEIVESVSGLISNTKVRENIEALEAELKKHPQAEIPITHLHFGGIYARIIVIPAETLLTGAIHKHDHIDVMISGDITVSSDDGKKRMTGFNIFPGAAGKKRAGFAHEDTYWVTFHICEPMADDEYRKFLTVDTFSELQTFLLDQQTKVVIDEKEIKKAFKSRSSYRAADYALFKAGYIAGINR